MDDITQGTLQILASHVRYAATQLIFPCDGIVQGMPCEALAPDSIRLLAANIRASAELISQLAKSLETEDDEPNTATP